jgi:hypothetical protein
MANPTKTLGNKLAESENENKNNKENKENTVPEEKENDVDNADEIDNEGADADELPAEQDPAIKNIELTGKDAENLNASKNKKNNNLTKKKNNVNTLAGNGSVNNRNLTQKRNNQSPNNTTGVNTTGANQLVNETETESPVSEATVTGDEPTKNINTPSNNTSNDKSKMRSLNNVAMNLFNHQVVLKLFHFQTELYGAHKASDAYLENFAGTMDKFLEIAQGIYGRITIKKYTLSGSSHTDANIVRHLDGIITLLREKIDDVLDNYTDLINVRDEIVGDVEQLKYLLTFK